MSSNKYGRSKTSKSLIPTGPNLDTDGAIKSTFPICNASISSRSLNNWLFGKTSTIILPLDFFYNISKKLAAIPFKYLRHNMTKFK